MKGRFALVVFAGWLALSAALSGSGCSNKKSSAPIVAVIGSEAVAVTEITDPLELQGQLFSSLQEELAFKRRLLDSLIDARLMVQEAYRQKLDQDSLLKAFAEQERPLFLADVLFFHEIRDKVRLSRSEVERFYRAFRVDRCYRQILTRHRRLADSLLVLVAGGARFDSLAMVHSRNPISGPTGGDIGCYGWNHPVPDELLEKIVETKPGETVGPFQSDNGWAILQCYEQRPAVLPDIKVFEPQLRNILEPYRENRRSADFVAELRKKLGFRIVDSAAQFVNIKQQELSKVPGRPGQPERYSIYLQTEKLTSAQRLMPLMIYKGGVFTVGQYLESLQGTMPLSRANINNSETNKALLFQYVFPNAMIQAALSRGLDKDAEFLKMLKRAVEGQMARLLQGRIYAAVPLDTSRARAYYRAHPQEFVLPAAVHLFEINRPRREEILTIKQNIRDKGQFVAAAGKLTARSQLQRAGGDMGWVEQHQFPELFAAAAKMKKGEIAGPVFLTDSSFSIIYLEERRAARKQSFAEVQMELTKRLFVQAQDSALAAWLAEAKRKTKVSVYPEVLEKTVDQTYYAKLKEWQEKKKEEAG